MTSSFTLSDVLAGLAFLLSVFATWKTVRFNDRQKSLIESQERLNKRLLAKEDEKFTEDKKAELGASFIKIGSSEYRLKIWNKGKAAARNVYLEFPSENDCFDQSEIDRKFPLEILETYQSVELIAYVSYETKSKHVIKLRWADEFSADNMKVVYPTI